MPLAVTARRFPARRHAAVPAWWAPLLLGGCNASPAQDIAGSFFPSWLLCAVLGILAAVAVRQLLLLARLDDRLVGPLPTYAAIAASATLAIWLGCFGN